MALLLLIYWLGWSCSTSTLSGSVPENRTAKHLFVTLSDFQEFLTDWTQHGDHVQEEIANWLQGTFLSEPLRDWDISRPGTLLRLRDPRRARPLLLRLARRADRLHRGNEGMVRARTATSFDAGGATPTARSTTSSARTSPTSTRSSGRRC